MDMKKISRDMRSMSRPCYIVLKTGLILASLTALLTIILCFLPEVFPDYRQYSHAITELRSYPALVLLVSSISAVCAEDAVRRRS